MKEFFGHLAGYGKPLLAAGAAGGSILLNWLGVISPVVAFLTVLVAFISACLHLWHRWQIIKENLES